MAAGTTRKSNAATSGRSGMVANGSVHLAKPSAGATRDGDEPVASGLRVPLLSFNTKTSILLWWAYTAATSFVLSAPLFSAIQTPLRYYPTNTTAPLLRDSAILLELVFAHRSSMQTAGEIALPLALLIHLGSTLPLTLLMASLTTRHQAPWLVPLLRGIRAFPGVALLTVFGQLLLAGVLAMGIWTGRQLFVIEASPTSHVFGGATALGCGIVVILLGRPLLDVVRVAHVQRRKGSHLKEDLGRGIEALGRDLKRAVVVHAGLSMLGWSCALGTALLLLRLGTLAPSMPLAVALWLVNQIGILLLLTCRTAWLRYCVTAVRSVD